MRFTPRFLGAAAAIVATGIASGAIIGTVPPVKRLAQQDLRPQASTTEIDYRQDSALPDHYPILTPQGRFEVHELTDRGLYSQARYAPYPYYEYAAYDAELAYAELEAAYETEPEARPAPRLPAMAEAGEMVEVPSATIAERRPEPPPTEHGSASAAPAVASVTSRIIDVRTELPARY